MDSAATEPEGTAGAPRVSLGKGRALVPVPAAPKPDLLAGLGRSHGVVAAGVAVVMGLGFVAGTALFASKPQTLVLAQAVPSADATADVLARLQGEVRSLKASLEASHASAEDGRAVETVRGLKRSVDQLKGDLEGAKAASAAAVGQLGAKLDKLDRDPSPKLAELSARLDKLDPDAKIAQLASQLTARVDRIERQVASSDATGSIPPAATATAQAVKAPLPPVRAAQPSPTGPAAAPVAVVPPPRPEAQKIEPAKAELPRVEQARAEPSPPRPDAPRQEAANRPATLDGWLLRDVYGGVALVEGRAGGLREVAPGEYVPGVGEIRSIERRGRGWVVVTSRGLIQADNRW